MVGLHVGDQGGVRRVDEEGAVALVGLGHEQLAAAVVGVGAGLVQVAADGEGRVGAAVLQRDGQQRGGGGLAVGAGDGDHDAALHHRLQGGRARQQAQPAPGRLDDLGVVLAHGGGDDDGVGVAEVGRGVADVAGGAQGAQRLEGARLLGVAAGDGDAAGQHDPRDPGQPRAADADEVHGAELVRGEQGLGDGDPHRSAPAAGARGEDHLGQLVVGVERDHVVAAARHRASRSGSVSRSGTVLRTHSGVSAASATSRPPPASTTGRALRACSPLPIGSGT